jgi:hypothetical protein
MLNGLSVRLGLRSLFDSLATTVVVTVRLAASNAVEQPTPSSNKAVFLDAEQRGAPLCHRSSPVEADTPDRLIT